MLCLGIVYLRYKKQILIEIEFQLQKDMENYVEYSTMGKVSQIKLKAGCLPTKFACQPKRPSTTVDLCRPGAVKRKRFAIIKECEELEEGRNNDAPSTISGNLKVLM